MQMKAAGGVLVIIALAVGGFVATRYTRNLGDALTSGSDASGGRARVRFSKDPAQVPADLTMTTLDGRTITTKDLEGKVTIVNFWATWCPPCRAEIPDLVKLQEQYKDHVVVIGISSDEGPIESVARFAADFKINYPVVMETDALTKAFPGVFALPTTFMVGPDLKIMKKHLGQIRPAQIELEARVLAKLPVDADVEYEPDAAQKALAGEALATDVPGVDLASLSPDQRAAALKRLNEEECNCGCGLTIAKCRIDDATCTVSPPLAEKIVAEVRAAHP